MRAGVWTVAAACLAVVAACAPAASPAEAPPTVGSPSASAASPSPGTPVLTATDADNGHALTVQRGATLRVVLSSTYWRFGTPSNPAVLAENGGQSFSPQPSGCVPGGGCGTVTDDFRALIAGQATVVADRTSCGEALLCQGAAGHFRLTVTVTG